MVCWKPESDHTPIFRLRPGMLSLNAHNSDMLGGGGGGGGGSNLMVLCFCCGYQSVISPVFNFSSWLLLGLITRLLGDFLPFAGPRLQTMAMSRTRG